MSFLRRDTAKEWFYSWPTAVFLLVVVVFLGRSAYERYQVEREMRERLLQTEASHNELESRQQALEERIEYVRGDRGVEEEMRQQFDVAKPGEQVIILTGEPQTTSTPVRVPAPEPVPWYQFWRN